MRHPDPHCFVTNNISMAPAMQLEALAKEKEGGPLTKPHTAHSCVAPIELRDMPSPIGVPIKNDLMNTAHVPHDTSTSGDSLLPSKDKAQKLSKPYEGKPGPLCEKCPLRESKYVSGRGGVVRTHCPSASVLTPLNGANLRCSS